jgi:hypothetical protein
MPHYHLAQINSGRILAETDSPVMAGFMARLGEINALAEASPGFVWRLQTAEGDATAIRPYEDPLVLLNVSVWESVEALRAFSYQSEHVQLLRQRGDWFERPAAAHQALWWVPAGHVPTAEEAVARLKFLRAYGPTAVAFGFGDSFPRWAEPEGEGADVETGLDGKRLAALVKDPNGDAGSDTVFCYRQRRGRVWAMYDGGRVRFGALTGVVTPAGQLDIRYHHVDPAGEIRTGWCKGTPVRRADGRMQLEEEWQWTNGNCQPGKSVLVELPE